MAFSILFFSAVTAVQAAEIQYVGDKLRVGVRAKPDRSLASIGVIVTGDAVDVLEKERGFLRIRTQKGMEGWVKSSYMSTQKPAKLLLEELRKSQQSLQNELKELRADKKPALDSNAAIQALKDKVAKLSRENRELRGLVAGDSNNDDDSWLYWFSGILAIGPLGFLLGLLWYRYQIMKKLGGLTL